MHYPLIHIGYHKTGTTWLQARLFSNKALGFGMVPGNVVHERIVRPHPLQFSPADSLNAVQSELDKISAEGLAPVISWERLSGNPHSGGFDNKEIADRLAGFFPCAKVVIVVREQVDSILSCYYQYVKIGGQASLKDYVNPPKRWSERIPMFRLDNFKYALLIGYYEQLFGSENVLVMPYETFRSEPIDFAKTILDFAGANVSQSEIEKLPFTEIVNRSLSPIELEVKRRLNFLYPTETFNPTDALPPDRQRMRQFVESASELAGSLAPTGWSKKMKAEQKAWLKQKIGNTFDECNATIANRHNLPLAKLGYSMAASSSDLLATSHLA